jgi:hypothetical protein
VHHATTSVNARYANTAMARDERAHGEKITERGSDSRRAGGAMTGGVESRLARCTSDG